MKPSLRRSGRDGPSWSRYASGAVRRDAVRRAREQDRDTSATCVLRHVDRGEQLHAVAHRDPVLVLRVVRADVEACVGPRVDPGARGLDGDEREREGDDEGGAGARREHLVVPPVSAVEGRGYHRPQDRRRRAGVGYGDPTVWEASHDRFRHHPPRDAPQGRRARGARAPRHARRHRRLRRPAGRPGKGRRRGRPRPAPRLRHLRVDRSAHLRERPRHLHDPQRLDAAARGPRGDGGGLAPLRAPRRAGRGSRRAARTADRRRVGHGHERLLGRPHARHDRLRHRRQPRPARADSRPARLPEGRVHHPEALAQRVRRGVRAVGVRVVEVATADELEAAFGPRTALVYVLAGPNADSGPLSTKALCDAANRRGVPVLVDAAAEILPVPNVAPADGRRARRLQRRQVPARPAGGGPAPRPQGPREGGLGRRRAPPRPGPRLQGRQGGVRSGC